MAENDRQIPAPLRESIPECPHCGARPETLDAPFSLSVEDIFWETRILCQVCGEFVSYEGV